MDESFKQHPDQPFFLYLAYNAPHFPLHARAADTRKYRGRFREVGWDKLRQQRYERMVELGLTAGSGRFRPWMFQSGKPMTPGCAMSWT